jgi:hypothetical protein
MKHELKVLFVVATVLIATVASNAVNYPKPSYPAPAYPSYKKSYDYVNISIITSSWNKISKLLLSFE